MRSLKTIQKLSSLGSILSKIAFILSVWIVFDIYFKGRSSKKR